MIVVSDSSPLIGLAQIQRLELLPCLFGEIFIPQAVYDEVVIAGRKKGRDVQAVSTATWIKTVVVSDPSSVGALLKELDEGEAETIVLAQALNAEWVLMACLRIVFSYLRRQMITGIQRLRQGVFYQLLLNF